MSPRVRWEGHSQDSGVSQTGLGAATPAPCSCILVLGELGQVWALIFLCAQGSGQTCSPPSSPGFSFREFSAHCSVGSQELRVKK